MRTAIVNAHDFAVRVYKAVDSMEAAAQAPFLTPDCTFVFGNSAPVKGREAIVAYVGGFFGMIDGMRHEVGDVWSVDDNVIVRLTVTYTRKDGKQMTFPAVVIWGMREELIDDYRIYVDNSPLFGP